jgi:putative N6-adenine-specific DNA methylase
VAWEIWFTTQQTFKIEITAQHSPLTSLNFAALKIKRRGGRPLSRTNAV